MKTADLPTAVLTTPATGSPSAATAAPAPSKVRWKPNVTVAAIIERDGLFLLVEEDTSDGLLLNNPAGHLDPGETPEEGVMRETLEETTRSFSPEAFVGVFLSRFRRTRTGEDITYMRLAYSGSVSEADATLQLDEGIVRTVWMSLDDIRACPERHRSPLLLECIEAYVAGARYPLDIVKAHASLFAPPAAHRQA